MTFDRSSAAGRLAKFVTSGGVSTVTLFVGSYGLAALGLRPFVANLVAYGIAFAVGYSLQHGWTFRGEHAHRRSLPRYFTVQVCCALISAVGGEVLARIGVPRMISAGLTTLTVSAISYFAALYWVFPKAKAEA
jgi:putative flippase GtrA